LRVVASFKHAFRVVGLSGGKNIALLADQVEAVCPEVVSCGSDRGSRELQSLLRGRGYPLGRTRFVHGGEGIIEVSCHPQADLVLSAITGAAGLLPTYRALESGKSVALANKETLVMAGQVMMAKARERRVEILPVDSEHNAIHQCLRGGRRDEVRRLILTASGGPFRETPPEDLAAVTPEQALAHPTWRMGRKITIDSATMMNKGLEVIEAAWLFGIPADSIRVAVHPQSIVHSMVEFVDGSVLAQLGPTDMRISIQYALTYPERWISPLPSLDIRQMARLEFHEPDLEKFRSLGLCYRALRTGGTAPAALNAANEVAVEAFLARQIPLPEIPAIIEAVLEAHRVVDASSLEAVLKADAWAREAAAALTHGKSCAAART
ncbi:MAG: 1-deoxy-D-xylulose-5-phosphate reductoisomerase, partial [Acidobacteria bacterium]|nr:1-deoxy-D-xylulose-5-phosphate reductoisomerase [Acidobacteriota bacterium]